MNNYLWTNFPDYDLADKKRMYNDYVRYLLARTVNIFKYEGLPETIPQRELETQIQVFGHVGVFQHSDGNLYALRGDFGGAPNPYYLPTLYTIANPALKIGKAFNINTNEKDCIICPNDSMFMGLLPLLGKTSKQLVENQLSLLMACINSRMSVIASAADDATLQGLKDYTKAIMDGKLSIAVADDAFFQSLKCTPIASAGSSEKITDLLEYNANLFGDFWKQIGLPFQQNQKREVVLETEMNQSATTTRPYIDDMLIARQKWVNDVNELFGTSITVDFNGIWKETIEQQKEEIQKEEIQEEENIQTKEEDKEDNENETK